MRLSVDGLAFVASARALPAYRLTTPELMARGWRLTGKYLFLWRKAWGTFLREHRPPLITTLVYLAMGWLVAPRLPVLIETLPAGAFPIPVRMR